MNLDFALVNRALLNIGQRQITLADKLAGNEAWQTAKIYYLSTMLEALAQVEWTAAKRRRELTPAQMPNKGNADFTSAYDMPIDCAKIIEIDDHDYFEVEGGLLYTGERNIQKRPKCLYRRTEKKPIRLLYVSNGRRLSDQAVVSGGNARRKPMGDHVTGGDSDRVRRYEWHDNVISGGGAKRKVPLPPDEDYPDYREMRHEPNFYLYWENLLSSKFALRLTDKAELSIAFYNKAQAIGRAAEVTSISLSASRIKAPETWQEELGLR